MDVSSEGAVQTADSFVCSFVLPLHPVPHRPLHESIHRFVGGERLPVTKASEEVEPVGGSGTFQSPGAAAL